MKWISVRDRLPEDDRTVLVCVADRYSLAGLVHFRVVCYCGSGVLEGWKYSCGKDSETNDITHWIEKNDVTHWMPLPEPPTGARYD